MKKLELKPNGLIWRLATYYGPCYDGTLLLCGTDLCTLVKAALIGLLRVLLIIFAFGLFAAMIGDTLAAGLTYWQYGHVELNPAAFMLILLLTSFSIIGISFGICYCGFLVVKWKSNRKLVSSSSKEEPSKLRQVYDSWKNKYCIMIHFAK